MDVAKSAKARKDGSAPVEEVGDYNGMLPLIARKRPQSSELMRIGIGIVLD